MPLTTVVPHAIHTFNSHLSFTLHIHTSHSHLVRRMPIEREDALCVECQVSRQAGAADAAEDELVRLQRRQVHACGQGGWKGSVR